MRRPDGRAASASAFRPEQPFSDGCLVLGGASRRWVRRPYRASPAPATAPARAAAAGSAQGQHAVVVRAMLGHAAATERCERQERSADLQERVGAPAQRRAARQCAQRRRRSMQARHLARRPRQPALPRRREAASAVTKRQRVRSRGSDTRRKSRGAAASEVAATAAAVRCRRACRNRAHGAARGGQGPSAVPSRAQIPPAERSAAWCR